MINSLHLNRERADAMTEIDWLRQIFPGVMPGGALKPEDGPLVEAQLSDC